MIVSVDSTEVAMPLLEAVTAIEYMNLPRLRIVETLMIVSGTWLLICD